MSGIKQGAVIPVYNHGSTAEPIVAFFAERHIPVILVDDGSYLKTKAALAKIEKKYPDDVTLLTLPENRGKGAAVMTGIEMAANLGLTHVLQIDADGQHDINRAEPFFELSKEHPEALICGYGVGLSWAAGIITVNTQDILPLIETDEYFDDGLYE